MIGSTIFYDLIKSNQQNICGHQVICGSVVSKKDFYVCNCFSFYIPSSRFITEHCLIVLRNIGKNICFGPAPIALAWSCEMCPLEEAKGNCPCPCAYVHWWGWLCEAQVRQVAGRPMKCQPGGRKQLTKSRVRWRKKCFYIPNMTTKINAGVINIMNYMIIFSTRNNIKEMNMKIEI